jgi:hypothetical protein
VSSVFDDPQATKLCDPLEGVHVCREARVVNRHEHASARRDDRIDGCRIQVVRNGIYIGEDRCASGVEHDVRGCTERQRRSDDFVTRADSCCNQRQVQRSSARIDSERTAGTDVVRERLFEFGYPWPGGQPPGFQCRNDFRDLVRPNRGP